jgi:tetratricopeptide (TPR) repeat protein
VAVLEPREAGARIRARSTHVELAASLVDWALVCRATRKEGDTTWKDLLAVARGADPDDRRNQLRDALERRDRKSLEELAASEGAADLPPVTLVLLGEALRETGAPEQEAALLRQAQRRHPDDLWINTELGYTLQQVRPLPGEEAIRICTVAVALRPHSPGLRLNLGKAFHQTLALEEAAATYREAIRLKKDYSEAHLLLSLALADKGQVEEAIAPLREALHIKKEYAKAQNNLGVALGRQGRLEKAIAMFREAIRLNKDYAEVQYFLGNTLKDKGQLEDAIAAYREGYAIVYGNLGAALKDKGQLEDAIAAFQEAIRLKNDFVYPHFYLGLAFVEKGNFRQAAEELRRGHELGSSNPRWPNHPYRTAEWGRIAERLVALEPRLPRLLEGKDTPADATDRLALAFYCQVHKQLYAAVHWYGEAFATEPRLLAEVRSGQRYDAACAAALAGCGQGKDAIGLDDTGRARLRRQALDWLRADLEAWHRQLEKEPVKDRPVVDKQLEHWLVDSEFVAVRGAEALDRLPEAERRDWQRLWQEVKDLQQRAVEPPKTEAAPAGR